MLGSLIPVLMETLFLYIIEKYMHIFIGYCVFILLEALKIGSPIVKKNHQVK